MKAAGFSWENADAVAPAGEAAARGAKIIAGGQSLGPMLNLRIAQPDALVSIAHLPALKSVSETEAFVTIGACVTHAQIADGLTPDIGHGVLPRIAEHIAYRAVRNRGTIGGSLCHADPAADWVTTLLALDAVALISNGKSNRAVPMAAFFTGAFRNCLAPDEILTGVQIPKLGRDARFGYYKACRKPGEFAHAMAAVFTAPARHRIVIGAMGGIPLVFENAEAEPHVIATALAVRAPQLDDVSRHMQLVAVKRAFESLTP
jgi:carbon-monoxide dehydrogenase medium subunit